MTNTDHDLDPNDLILTPADHIEEAEAFEHEVKCILDGTHEVPPWADRVIYLAYHIEVASQHRQAAEELSQSK